MISFYSLPYCVRIMTIRATFKFNVMFIDIHLEDHIDRAGRIAIQLHHHGSHIRFKEMKIKVLD